MDGYGYWNTTVRVLGDPQGYDPNGSNSGCGHLGHLGNARWYAWAVCVQYEGCSPWAMFSPPAPTIPARAR